MFRARPFAPTSRYLENVGRVCLLIATLLLGCGGDGGKYAAAGVTAGAAVALAGVNRAATGGCWADCRPGTRCDSESGTCVPIACGGACGTDERCVRSDQGEVCVQAVRDTSAPLPESSAVAPPGDAGADPCRGLCLRGERCAVDAGVADCLPAPSR